MNSYNSMHLVADEITDKPLVVKSEMDDDGTLTLTMYIKGEKQNHINLTLDEPSGDTIVHAIQSAFQDYNITKKGAI